VLQRDLGVCLESGATLFLPGLPSSLTVRDILNSKAPHS
jgi:hypothetical protein